MNHPRLRIAFLSSLVVALQAVSVSASAQVKYKITDLGSLGAKNTMPYAINNNGQVVGSSSIAGGALRAFVWSNGTMTNLGTLPGFGSASEAYDINDKGQIVGYSRDGGQNRAFIYQNGAMTDPATPGSSGFSRAEGINESGQVVGFATYALGVRATQWSSGTMTNLGLLNNGVSNNSFATDVNESGQAVGYSDMNAIHERATLFSNGTATDLGTLGGLYSLANAINDQGQVVGWSEIDLKSNPAIRAFIWQNGTMTSLGTLGGAAEPLISTAPVKLWGGIWMRNSLRERFFGRTG